MRTAALASRVLQRNAAGQPLDWTHRAIEKSVNPYHRWRTTWSTSGLLIGLLGLWLAGPPVGRTSAQSPPVFVGAGDIAGDWNTDEATAQLLDGIAGGVFTLGDNVYPNGTATEFLNFYHPTWGRHVARTFPSPGNHDYNSSGAVPYFNYYYQGNPALQSLDPSRNGYYSFNLDTWHIVSLNSNVARGVGSVQEQWLRADLAASAAPCTLAYWHHPRFSSGGVHGNDTSMDALFRALYDHGVEVLLSGHDHIYERFAPQNPDAQADLKGVRAFVVGTGGVGLYSFGTIRANSQVRNNTAHGVLKLTLHPGSYQWEFIPIAGSSFRDSGSSACISDLAAPTMLVGSVAASTVTLTWQPPAPSGGLTSYVIEAGTTPGAANLTTFNTGNTATSLVIPNVGPGTYYVRVRAANNTATSAPSNEVTIVVGAPSNLVGVVTGTTVTLIWQAPTSTLPPTSYVVEVGTLPGSANLAAFNTGTAATQLAIPGVPLGTYYVRVRAVTAGGAGPASNEATIVVTGSCQAPAVPANLTFSTSGQRVTLSWSAAASATSYVVEVGSSSGLANLFSGDVGNVLTISAPAPSGVYFVRVRGANACGASLPSNQVMIGVP